MAPPSTPRAQAVVPHEVYELHLLLGKPSAWGWVVLTKMRAAIISGVSCLKGCHFRTESFSPYWLHAVFYEKMHFLCSDFHHIIN